MNAELIYRTKETHGQGLIEVGIWRVLHPVPPSEHPFKYRLVYIVEGKRVVGYDNEHGKSDHKHLGEHEVAYTWVSPQQLILDFMRDINEVNT